MKVLGYMQVVVSRKNVIYNPSYQWGWVVNTFSVVEIVMDILCSDFRKGLISKGFKSVIWAAGLVV